MNRYNQASHLTQDTNWKVTASQVDITNESQKVKCFSIQCPLKLVSMLIGVTGEHILSVNSSSF